MDYQPTKPYIYQPEPVYAKDGTLNERIYGIGGPGTDHLWDKRYTRSEAEAELKSLIASSEKEANG